MQNKLQEVFPGIRMREEILQEIQNDDRLREKFGRWDEEQQNEFLDFCSGTKGNRVLYDAFFKEVLNPEYVPERLEELLSLLLERDVKILSVLPADSTRMADETSLVIMDIVVELDDSSIANCEIQRRGYAFPGQRSACYSADLLLRQYKRVRDKYKRTEKGRKKFNYREIQKVYTIIFFEKSTQEFHAMPDAWLHYCKQASNTGLKVELLQEYVFIPLDIFRTAMQNKTIENKLEAWLFFFCIDEPGRILELIERYPEFKDMYEEVYDICQNTERMMDMFSKELRELDRNTVHYMMDEMQDELDEMWNELNERRNELNERRNELKEKQDELKEKQNELDEKRNELKEKQDELNEKKGIIDEQQNIIANLKADMFDSSVCSFIKACKRFTKDKSVVAKQLQEEFSFDSGEVLEVVEKYWG